MLDALAKSVLEAMKGTHKRKGRIEGEAHDGWLVVDFGDVVVHLFEPNTRSHYDLEMMWGDAPRMEWERPDQIPRDRAKLNA